MKPIGGTERPRDDAETAPGPERELPKALEVRLEERAPPAYVNALLVF